jgi:acyl-CoA reductase-like NAD-dependent aldehyde dehydrogenase
LTVSRNAPYVFGVRSAATAIATGNTTVLKGSELTPRCYWAVGKAFHQAGLPAGVLNVLSCPPSKAEEIVNVMIEHPAVRHVNFTGSAAVGRKVARMCGQNLKPCLMELGGKNSAIVLEDADLQKAAEACFAGSFASVSGNCPGRLNAHKCRRARSAWRRIASSYAKR